MSDPEDIDLLAAEYVLGTLDAAERAGVASRLGVEGALARAVEEWQDRLSPLDDAVPDIAPPPAIYDGLVTRLFGPAGRMGVGVASVRRATAGTTARATADTVPLRRLRRWQTATAGFGLLAASLLAWVGVHEVGIPAERSRLVAVLQRDAGSPAMVVDVDLAARRLLVRPVGAPSPAGHAYELWIVDPTAGAPRSLGVVPPLSETHASLSGIDPAVITNATYAVTVESAGGSPTGLPTTAPILSGKVGAALP